MRNDRLSQRQLIVAIITALVTPAIALLPSLTTQLAGSAAWLTTVGMVPLLLAACWASRDLFAPETMDRKRPWKYVIIILYLIWVTVILSVALRLTEERLSRLYGKQGGALCAVAVLLIALWMGWGKLSAFGRTGQIFFLALSVLTISIILLALGRVELSSLEVQRKDIGGFVGGSIASAGLLLNVCPVSVLTKWIPHKQSSKRYISWVVAFCVMATLLVAAVVGCLGPKLTARVPAPFYIMLQGLGIKGAFQRLEAPVAALFTLSDLVLMGLLLHAWQGLASSLYPGKWTKAGIIPVAIAALAGGGAFLHEAETLWFFCSAVLPVVGICLGFILPFLIKGLGCIRRRCQKG